MERAAVLLTAAIGFLLKMASGLRVPKAEPGMIPGGGANEPLAVFAAAVMAGVLAGLLAYGLIRILSWIRKDDP